MDLGAYIQIKDLDEVMKENGIYVPRLRGLRLMRDESPLSEETINEVGFSHALYECENIVTHKYIGLGMFSTGLFGEERKKRLKKYFRYDDPENDWMPTSIKWDAVHGKKRKMFKYAIKYNKREAKKQFDMFNKYCGRDDVLYIHAKQGRDNWSSTDYRDLEKEPWYLDAVEDSFDSVYCDIYAKIKPVELHQTLCCDPTIGGGPASKADD